MCFTVHYRLRFNLCCFCLISGFPGGSAGKGSACDVGDLGLIPGLERFPGKGEHLLTPVSWPGEFHGLYSPGGCKELDTTNSDVRNDGGSHNH